MERRSFLKLSTITALTLGLPLVEGCGTDPKVIALALPLLFSHLVDVKAVKEAGLAYRKINPSEDDEVKLSDLLLSANQREKVNKYEIQTLLDKQVTSDFKAGNIVTADGWIMSGTEARQCALFSIINRNS